MFTGRIPVLIEMLKDFTGIDDPYIKERLCAVAYGCVLQSSNKKEDISNLGYYIYKDIFRNKKPPAHILLRDYARGVVEVALKHDATLKNRINVANIRPPYNSSFPKIIPSLAYLKHRYPRMYKSSKTKERLDYGAIWHSLMYSNEGGISDFGNYVVNSALGHWANLKLSKDGSRRKTAKEMNTEFNLSLSRKEKN